MRVCFKLNFERNFCTGINNVRLNLQGSRYLTLPADFSVVFLPILTITSTFLRQYIHLSSQIIREEFCIYLYLERRKYFQNSLLSNKILKKKIIPLIIIYFVFVYLVRKANACRTFYVIMIYLLHQHLINT